MTEEDRFYGHANSINGLEGIFHLGPTKDLPCAQAIESIIYHLQCEIYILRDEIERLKEKLRLVKNALRLTLATVMNYVSESRKKQ